MRSYSEYIIYTIQYNTDILINYQVFKIQVCLHTTKFMIKRTDGKCFAIIVPLTIYFPG